MKIEDMIFECRCQKCPAPMTLTSMLKLKGPVEGTLLVPDRLICANCGAVMTAVMRKIRDEEKPKKE